MYLGTSSCVRICTFVLANLATIAAGSNELTESGAAAAAAAGEEVGALYRDCDCDDCCPRPLALAGTYPLGARHFFWGALESDAR